ncbi:hypothetical protein ACLQ3K_21905 [Tsukamurella sp. DT100]|uniref:hypothetical protein n=1 Tax=Tsukamurella sp. DT100 TaxID=3393415 RepID=UPI003CEC7850
MIELERVAALPPVVPAWCEDMAEQLQAAEGVWFKWPRTGFPGEGAADAERDEFRRHFGDADGYLIVKRDGRWFVSFRGVITR